MFIETIRSTLKIVNNNVAHNPYHYNFNINFAVSAHENNGHCEFVVEWLEYLIQCRRSQVRFLFELRQENSYCSPSSRWVPD